MPDSRAGRLQSGQTIAHYRLIEPLGAGGMGIVYKAEDIRLHRFVALKLLPDDVAGDPAALARFRREAQAASALNHPNICTIYDIGESDGSAYIAMEYLDGTPLDRVINGRPVPLETILAAGIDVADALGAAHAAGILHRDIKPPNISLTSRGSAKILDFGIARIDDAGNGHVERVTMTALTNPGTTMGTAAYMSPEQVRGLSVDARSDLFSFGCVLYEMATGVQPFRGETPGVIFDAILNRDPVPPIQLNASLPPELDRVIRKAIEKDRDVRFQSATDIRADLKRLARGSSPAEPAPRAQTSVSRTVVAAGVAVLMLTAAAAAAWWFRTSSSEPFAEYGIAQVTHTGNAGVSGISPDGKFIVSVQRGEGVQSLWLRNVPTGSDTAIAPPQGVIYGSVAFSPDGNYVYFRRTEGATTNLQNLYRQPVLGGEPLRLVTDIDTPVGFSPSGDRIVFGRANNPEPGKVAIIIAAADGTNERILVTAPISAAYTSAPSWSPDGGQIAFTENFLEGALGRLTIADVATGQTHVPFSTNQATLDDPVWTPDGRNLLVLSGSRSAGTQRQIAAISYPSGAFRPITNDTNTYSGLRMSGDGRSIVTVQTRIRELINVMPGGGGSEADASELVTAHERLGGISWTPDGEVLFARRNRIIAQRPGGRERTVFTGDADTSLSAPSACAGGRELVFLWLFRPSGSTQQLWRVNADGTNAAALFDSDRAFGPTCSPDAQWVTFTHSATIDRVSLAGGTPEQLGQYIVQGGTDYSPDGRTIAAIALVRSAQPSVAARRMLVLLTPGSAPRLMKTDQNFAGGNIRFTRDGAAVAYAVRQKVADQIVTQPLDGSPGRTVTAFTSGRMRSFAWSPDGQSLALTRGYGDSDVVLLTDTVRRP